MPSAKELATELERLHTAAETTADGQPEGLGETDAALFDYFMENFHTILGIVKGEIHPATTEPL